ncbi:MAG TPA: hypothetical protein VHE35_12605 [Kofleriaceae bacterium]|nr:hypothetical protein [Kofleriaceae bacterium]
MVDVAADRARRARALLHGGQAGFVLVAGPRDLVVAEAGVLAAQMNEAAAPLGAIVLNRAQPRWTADEDAVFDVLASLAEAGASAEDLGWLRGAWDEARAAVAAEDVALARFADALPGGVAVATIPEADGDVHTLRALAAMADRL